MNSGKEELHSDLWPTVFSAQAAKLAMGARTESSLEEKDDDDDEEQEEEEEERRRSSVPASGRIKDDMPNSKHKVVLEEEDVKKEADKEKEERKEEDGKEENEDGKRERKGFSFPLLKKFTDEPVKLRVHDVKIEGNVRTKDAVVEAEFEKVKNAENSQELLREVALAMSRIEGLGIFEECLISLEPGPIELPGTTNVFVNVKEPKNSYSGDVGIYTKPEVESLSLFRCTMHAFFSKGIEVVLIFIKKKNAHENYLYKEQNRFQLEQ